MNNTTTKPKTCSMPALAPEADWEANDITHHYIDGRCMDCDVREGGRASTWPCGTQEPRIVQDVRLAFRRTDQL